MVVRDTAWPAGTPSWVDMSVDDFGKAQAFYTALFDWDLKPGAAEFGGYSTALLQGRAVAGVMPKQQPDQPTAWLTYIAADNADDTATRIRSAGGTVAFEPMDVMDLGRMAIAQDPAGGFFGVWQAGRHIGFGVANEPGAVVWNEVVSHDYDASVEFYTNVFGYTHRVLPDVEPRVGGFQIDGRDVASIVELPSGDTSSSGWTTYFSVSDADSAAAKVRSLGGQVLTEPVTEFFGRFATVSDDQGATFRVISGAN